MARFICSIWYGGFQWSNGCVLVAETFDLSCNSLTICQFSCNGKRPKSRVYGLSEWLAAYHTACSVLTVYYFTLVVWRRSRWSYYTNDALWRHKKTSANVKTNQDKNENSGALTKTRENQLWRSSNCWCKWLIIYNDDFSWFVLPNRHAVMITVFLIIHSMVENLPGMLCHHI